METTSVHTDFLESIERLNRMLFMLSGAGSGFEEKRINPTAAQDIEGLGDMVDCYR